MRPACGQPSPACTRQALSRGASDPQKNTEFGYSRKDILLIGGGIFALGYGSYYGLQAAGVEPGMAGNFVQFGIFVFFCVGWIASYLFRVLNKVCAPWHTQGP